MMSCMSLVYLVYLVYLEVATVGVRSNRGLHEDADRDLRIRRLAAELPVGITQ